MPLTITNSNPSTIPEQGLSVNFQDDIDESDREDNCVLSCPDALDLDDHNANDGNSTVNNSAVFVIADHNEDIALWITAEKHFSNANQVFTQDCQHTIQENKDSSMWFCCLETHYQNNCPKRKN